MTNILFDCPNANDFKDELCEYIRPGMRVAVIALSYYDDTVYDNESFLKIYGNGGVCYCETVTELGSFGINEDDISFINYFDDTKASAEEKIKRADLIYFTGGLPDKMMERIQNMGIEDAIRSHTGTVMGYSAGAVIQLLEYHLSPDGDYPKFGYYKGLGLLDSFHIEVHYEHRDTQDASIKRVLRERNKPVYVTHTRMGGIVVSDGVIKMIGKVDLELP